MAWIQSPAQEVSYAVGAAIKVKKKKNVGLSVPKSIVFYMLQNTIDIILTLNIKNEKNRSSLVAVG